MKNYKTELVSEEKDIHVSTTCNKCSKLVEPQQVDFYVWETFAYPFYIDFKEGSEYEREKWGFDLCEECVIELIKTFNIPPEWFGHGKDAVKHFEKWKETGVKEY